MGKLPVVQIVTKAPDSMQNLWTLNEDGFLLRDLNWLSYFACTVFCTTAWDLWYRCRMNIRVLPRQQHDGLFNVPHHSILPIYRHYYGVVVVVEEEEAAVAAQAIDAIIKFANFLLIIVGSIMGS